MFRHVVAFVIMLFISFCSNAQSLNNYKYIVVPDSYSFLKGEKDRYQLNSLTKFLFKKYGFTAIINGEPYPDDLQKGGCNALYADVDNVSSLFRVKLKVVLKDCNNATVFTSLPGKSMSKEFKQGYQEALRDAFKGVKKLNYSYKEPVVKVVPAKELVEQDVVSKKVITAPVEAVSVQKYDDKTNSSSSHDKKVVYLFNGGVYDFEKVDNGYLLHKVHSDGTTKAIGRLLSGDNESNYIVKAAELSGKGVFDSFGNFVLERINPATGKTIKDIFAREDR